MGVRQIAAARNAGAQVANGEFLIFVDADTLVSSNVIQAALQALSSGTIGGGATVRFDGPIPIYAKLLLPAVLWGSRLIGMASGCFIFCTKTAFQAAGGFDTNLYAAEEAVLSRALRKQGTFQILKTPVTTSGRKLRTYSARQILGTLTKLAFLGRRGLRDRSRLGIWYEPRRPDSMEKASAQNSRIKK